MKQVGTKNGIKKVERMKEKKKNRKNDTRKIISRFLQKNLIFFCWGEGVYSRGFPLFPYDWLQDVFLLNSALALDQI